MTRTLVLFLLFSCISADLVNDIVRTLLPPEKPSGTCGKINVFMYSLFKQCPAMKDTCCLSGFVHPSDYKTALTCSLSLFLFIVQR